VGCGWEKAIDFNTLFKPPLHWLSLQHKNVCYCIFVDAFAGILGSFCLHFMGFSKVLQDFRPCRCRLAILTDFWPFYDHFCWQFHMNCVGHYFGHFSQTFNGYFKPHFSDYRHFQMYFLGIFIGIMPSINASVFSTNFPNVNTTISLAKLSLFQDILTEDQRPML